MVRVGLVVGFVAGGLSAGGFARPLDSAEFTFNRKSSLLPGLIASGAGLREPLSEFLGGRGQLNGK